VDRGDKAAQPGTIRHPCGVVCPLRNPPRTQEVCCCRTGTRRMLAVTMSKGRQEHRMPGVASDLEAFSRQPTGLASRQRPSDRALYHLPEPVVPLVLNRITIAMHPNSRVNGLNPAHVPCLGVNNPTIPEFCFGRIGRADIEGSKSNVAMNAWLPQASYPFGNFSDTSSFDRRRIKDR